MAFTDAENALIDIQLAMATAERLFPNLWARLRTAQRRTSRGSLRDLRDELTRLEVELGKMLAGFAAAEAAFEQSSG